MGLVGGSRSYDGPGLGHAPWKCPACAVLNVGPLGEGCTSCGSGSARPQHVGQPPRVETAPPRSKSAYARAVAADPIPSWKPELSIVAEAWVEQNPLATIAEGFMAGYRLAVEQFTARAMAAPPVTADLASLAPEGKVRRTIIAALELFKDQVLRDAKEEIASGEWCSIEEVDQIIAQFKQEEQING